MRTTMIAALALSVAALAAPGVVAQTKPGGATATSQSGAKAGVTKPRADYGKYEFSLTTLEGKSIKLSDYAGKVVLVNLWAPWCGPCKVEMPGFAKLHEKYADKGFEIISVAVQTNESAVRSFIEKTPLNWPVGNQRGRGGEVRDVRPARQLPLPAGRHDGEAFHRLYEGGGPRTADPGGAGEDTREYPPEGAGEVAGRRSAASFLEISDDTSYIGPSVLLNSPTNREYPP